ncbi:hypothetical protein C4J95_5305 [Pseudomonas orientalis]|nr:hypothetical protein C4J96_5350 [Pseudomonas orientalis]AZF02719.1 hypothetical protein C4J95_5305 [Pseudomonas orientalis]
MQGKCGRGLAPDCGVSGTEYVTDAPLSGASPLPQGFAVYWTDS